MPSPSSPSSPTTGLPPKSALPSYNSVVEENPQADKASHNSDNSDDSGVVDWKDTKSVVDNNRHMLESQMSCDVMFIVGEKRQQIGAHKFVLMTRSEVFRHMFNGPDSTKSEFVIPDIPGDFFWEMLRHIYCEDQKLEVKSVVGIMYAADQYNLLVLKQACLDFLHKNLEINYACYLLVELRKYGYPEEEKIVMSFIRKNAEDVFKTKGMDLLSRELLNELLTLPGLDVDESVKKEAVETWARNHQEEKKIGASVENLMDSLNDCLYVYRDDASSHRYVMDSVTTRNIFEEKPEPEALYPNLAEYVDSAQSAKAGAATGMDEVDRMSTMSGATSRKSSVHTLSRLPSFNMWADVEQVTRLQEVSGTAVNNAAKADAISFTVDHNLYFYGFSIYGPKKEGEAKYTVDTILTRKKKDIVMESICIKGAGVILPVMFERPVKIDKGYPYTLEVYIKGPDSYMGASGQTKIQHGKILFTFNNAAKVKHNRTGISQGQIPRLYFLPRNK
ncbi:BTB/POZ domain-containing protein 6 [Plakobranchus ocellatus]|uniref:BTB/POZ domain-containing protein 6 n=1 Tax=Plakobranchus ocellatus TaxID=259542 RepID=A0AAV4AFE7_9GAST|nr:BTB/POZ domain-containing protein 6 [Plakobranchus ocellatus]